MDEAQDALQRSLEGAGGDVALAYLNVVTAEGLPQASRTLTATLYQDVGYLLLDRIRFRPCGTVAGDLVYSLGLAPRERVVLTQKAWTKRSISLEETIGREEETTIEFSSSFSTEIGENTEHQQQRQQSSTFNATASLAYGPVSASVGYGATASDSSSQTASQSARRAREQTRKVSDRAKKEHRITFKTETETGIENISQRTLENPNTCHSLMLNIFRVYQRFEVFGERWGARACWAPCVVDPGRDLRPAFEDPDKIGMTEEEKAYIQAALTWDPPDMPPIPAAQTFNSEWSERVWSSVVGFKNDVSTVINIPEGSSLISISYERREGMNWGTVDVPYVAGHVNPSAGATGQQTVWWHIGLGNCYILGGCDEPWGQVRTTYQVAPTSDALKLWTDDLNARRKSEYDRRLKEVQNRITAQQAALDAEAKALAAAASRRVASFDQWTELMRRVVDERLTPDRYNSCTEVTLWNDVFEWENASYELFPSWWAGHAPTGTQSVPTDFLNASWARLYVPIRPGLEMVAFQLLFGPQGTQLQGFVDDLDQFRSETFGEPGAETVLRLGRWEELMPTDGTILEPVVGNCGACDEQLEAELHAQTKLIEAQAAALTERPSGRG